MPDRKPRKKYEKKTTYLAIALASAIISHSALSYNVSHMDWYAEAAKLDGFFIPPTYSEYIIPKGTSGLVWDYVTNWHAADWISTSFNLSLSSQGGKRPTELLMTNTKNIENAK